jgi:hypothetical protein
MASPLRGDAKVADWPIHMPCERCERRTAHRIWIAPLNLALCEGCFLAHEERTRAMADQKQDNGPYQLYGRRTQHEPEVRVGSHDDLDKAKDECNDMVDSGVWHHASVRDRNDRTVHVGAMANERDPRPGGDGPPPAA